jgi:hypothetical protein
MLYLSLSCGKQLTYIHTQGNPTKEEERKREEREKRERERDKEK